MSGASLSVLFCFLPSPGFCTRGHFSLFIVFSLVQQQVEPVFAQSVFFALCNKELYLLLICIHNTWYDENRQESKEQEYMWQENFSLLKTFSEQLVLYKQKIFSIHIFPIQLDSNLLNWCKYHNNIYKAPRINSTKINEFHELNQEKIALYC